MDDDRVRFPNRRDRRKWCRGTVGRVHVWATMACHPQYPELTGVVEVCQKCGKRIRIQFRPKGSYPLTEVQK